MKVAIFSILMVSISVSLAQTPQVQEVIAPIGKIRGNFGESRLGKRFFSARGIRYAEPPVGEKRFKQAVPVVSWTDVFDATQEGPACPHPNATLPSEDCLRLNVYTPELSSGQKPGLKKAVLVFFHPGGFYGMSGQSINFGPEFLMDQDIVLVTVNYRLMSLGFISTGDAHAPGNLGMKDQVEALRWIKKNIGAFGGDPNNVTISGYSAGGWSVTLHMVSPMSKGLFHRAIAMSGSATHYSPLGDNQLHLAKRQARLLNCSTDTSEKIIQCLRTKPVEDYLSTFDSMFEWYGNPILLWAPVVEPAVEGVERFLTDEPENLIRQGKFHHVPLVAGLTKEEFAGVVVYWVDYWKKVNNSLFVDINDNWETLAPILFSYERDTPRSKEISRELRSFYFQDQPISIETVDGIGKLYNDGVRVPMHRLVNLMAAVSTKPVYYYGFTYQGRFSHYVWPDTQKPYGVSHHDDLLYLFYMKKNFPYFNVTDPEYAMVKRYTSMWTSFAKTGNPIPEGIEEFKNVVWEPFTLSNKKNLLIGETFTMSPESHIDRLNKWDELFPPARPVRNNVKH